MPGGQVYTLRVLDTAGLATVRLLERRRRGDNRGAPGSARMSRRIAILGAGKMGEALIAGLLSSGWRQPDEIVAADRRPERLEEVSAQFGASTTSSPAEAVMGAEIVVIAVKPRTWMGCSPTSAAS